MNNNLEFENEDPSPDSIEDNHPRTNYGEGYGGKETLEEAAERYYIDNIFCDGITEFEHDIAIRCYIAGAKHTTERMYSEEELQVKLYLCLGHFAHKHNIIINGSEIDKWFEQFKNK